MRKHFTPTIIANVDKLAFTHQPLSHHKENCPIQLVTIMQDTPKRFKVKPSLNGWNITLKTKTAVLRKTRLIMQEKTANMTQHSLLTTITQTLTVNPSLSQTQNPKTLTPSGVNLPLNQLRRRKPRKH
jgi:hypothetical protein